MYNGTVDWENFTVSMSTTKITWEKKTYAAVINE